MLSGVTSLYLVALLIPPQTPKSRGERLGKRVQGLSLPAFPEWVSTWVLYHVTTDAGRPRSLGTLVPRSSYQRNVFRGGPIRGCNWDSNLCCPPSSPQP